MTEKERTKQRVESSLNKESRAKEILQDGVRKLERKIDRLNQDEDEGDIKIFVSLVIRCGSAHRSRS